MCAMAKCALGPDMQHCRLASSSETPWIKGKDSCCPKQCYFVDKETGEPCKNKENICDAKTGPKFGMCPVAMCKLGHDMQHCRLASASETPWIKRKDSCCQKQCYFVDKETGEPCKKKENICDSMIGPKFGMCPVARCALGPDMKHCRLASSSETPWIKGKNSAVRSSASSWIRRLVNHARRSL